MLKIILIFVVCISVPLWEGCGVYDIDIEYNNIIDNL